MGKSYTKTSTDIDMRQSMFESLNKTFTISKMKTVAPMPMPTYHYHELYELYYLCSGERYYFIKDKTYHINPGTVVLINKYDIHYTAASENVGFERFLINFSGDFLSEILSAIGEETLLNFFKYSAPVIELDEKGREHTESLLNTIYEEFKKNPDSNMSYIKVLMTELLIYLSRNENVSSDPSSGYMNSSHKIISEITGYINNNFMEDITLTQISEKYYISLYHLSRTFKKVTGLSFVEYLNNIRIKEAQRLMQTPGLTLSHIGQNVGYKSPTHFTRAFKKITGMPPIAYKKQLEKKL